MNNSAFEIRSSSSSQGGDVTFSSSNSSISSQQNSPGNQSQTRRRHSLSLKKVKRENSDQSDSCDNTSIENKSRQSQFSSMENPSTLSSTTSRNNCEIGKSCSGQSIGNSTSLRPVTEHFENHSESKEGKTADIFDICELNVSSQSSSSNISSQHEAAGSRLQPEHDHLVISHEQRQRERKEDKEQPEKNSKGYKSRKSLFAVLEGPSSSSSDSKTVTGSVVSCAQSQRPGNASNIRKTSHKSLVKPLHHKGSQKKQQPCSSSHLDASSDIIEANNIFGSFSHEKKTKADNYNLATPKLQDHIKETKYGTKAVKDTQKQKSHEGAIVIDDSPDRNTHFCNSGFRLSPHVQEIAVHHGVRHSTLEVAGGTPHMTQGRTLSENGTDRQENDSPDRNTHFCNSGFRLSPHVQETAVHHGVRHSTLEVARGTPHMTQGRTLSENGTDGQENISRAPFSQVHGAGLKKLSQRQSSDVSAILFEHLKQQRPAIKKLLQSQMSAAAVKQSSQKKLTEDTVVISSDEEGEGGKKSRQVQTSQRRESGFSKKTLGLRISRFQKQASSTQKESPSTQKQTSSTQKAISSTPKQNSSTNLKQSWKCNEQMVTDSLNSSGSCHANVIEMFPALVNSSGSSLSKEIHESSRRSSLSKETDDSSRRSSLCQETSDSSRRSSLCQETSDSSRRSSSSKETHDSSRRSSSLKETHDSSRRSSLSKETHDSSRRSSLSEEIPYQGEIPSEDNAKKDSRIPSFVTMSSDTSERSMPSLQRKQSSIYRNSSFEECSPPMLSQYPVQSPTSLHPPEVIHLVDSPSPLKNDVNRSADDDVISSESSMFTECSVPNSSSPDLRQMVGDILDMIDAAADQPHSVGTTHSQYSKDSQTDSLLQPCELKTCKPSDSSESSTRQLNMETDLKVTQKEGYNTPPRGEEKPYHDSEMDKDVCVLDSDEEFFMNEPFEDTHSSEKQELEKPVKDGGANGYDVNNMDGQVLAERAALNHLEENKADSVEDTSGSIIPVDAGLAVFEEGEDQNDRVPVVSTPKQQYAQEPSAAADFSVVIAESPGGRDQTLGAALAVVKEEVDDTAFTGAADASMYTEINDDLYILDSDDDEFFMSQSVLSNHCEDNPANGESSQASVADLPVVKEEIDGPGFTVAAGVSVYSEIDDDLYILNSDDDEFFLTQSVLNNPSSEKQEDEQNCVDKERECEMYEVFSHDLFEDEDEVTYDKKLSKKEKVFIKDMPGCSSAYGDDDADFEIGNEENDNFDDLDKETQMLAPLRQENTDDSCPEIAQIGNSDDGNELCEVNKDDMAKNNIDDDEEDEYFFSQMDDVDEAYFADTQVDYTNQSDDEFDNAESKEECNGDTKSSRIDRSSSVTCDRRGTLLEDPQYVENTTVSACETGDTQDPFAVQTQICHSSTADAQNEYDVATLPVSIMVDEESQGRINKEMHTTLEVTTKQILNGKSTAVFSKTPDQNLQEGQELAVSPLLNADTQDPFGLETQLDSDVVRQEHHSFEQGLLPASQKLCMQSVFTMETQECFQRENQDMDPYHQETQAVSPCSSDSSECMFTPVQTQIFPEPEMNVRNKTDRERVGDYALIKEDEHSFSGTETLDSLRLARNGQFKNGSRTSCVFLNGSDRQDTRTIVGHKNDQLLAEDDAFKEQTEVFSAGKELQSPYNVATQKHVQSESRDDQAVVALLNDDDIENQFNHNAHNNDSLVLSEDDNAYEGQTQVFSPAQELETSYNLATQRYAQSDTKENHADETLLNGNDQQDQCNLGTQVIDQVQSEEDVYGGQTQAFPPGKDSQSYGLATQKYVPYGSGGDQAAVIILSDDYTQDRVDLSAQGNDSVQSEEDFAYGGQTQAFSPGKDSLTSYDIATQKYIQSESSHDHASIILSDDDDTPSRFDLMSKVNDQLQSDEDCAYGVQTQAFSPAKSSQGLYNTATQKNLPSEVNDHHLFDVQTLVDSTLPLNDARQDLLDDETHTKLQPSSNDKYIYEMQTLANSPREESESVYNMATQKQCEPEDKDPGIHDSEKCCILSAVGAVTQGLPSKKTERNQSAVLEDRCLFEQETLPRSQSKETGDLYNMQTQNSFQPNRNNHALIGTEMPITLLDEDTQDPIDGETQGARLASEDTHPCEGETLAACQEEDCENLYSKATQKICQPERNSPNPYCRETLAMSPNGEEMFCAEKSEDSKSVEEKLSPSSTVDTQDPFDMDTDFSSLEDCDAETFAASLVNREECNLLTQTGLSPVKDHGISSREATAAPASSHGVDESSSDSECFLTITTQKDSSSSATDQDPYSVQTQAASSSCHEDIRDPFSIETLIDSPPSGLEIVSPYDRNTLDNYVVSEDNPDPYSLETEPDTSSFEVHNSVSRKTALANSSGNREAVVNYVIGSHNMSLVQTLIPHEKIAADLSVIGTGSGKQQMECDLTVTVKSNAPLPTQDNLLKYSEDHICKSIESLTPEPAGESLSPSKAGVPLPTQDGLFKYSKENACKGVESFTPAPDGDSLLPNKAAAHSNIEENIHCTQNQDSKVKPVQSNAKNSDGQILPTTTNTVCSMGENSSSNASLIKNISLNVSQKVYQPSKEFSDVGDISEQDFQSPYFAKHKPNSPTFKDTNITETCGQSSPALELSIQPRQKSSLSESPSLSQQPCQEDKPADRISTLGNSSQSEVHKKQFASLQPSNSRLEGYVQKNVTATDASNNGQSKTKYMTVTNVFSSLNEMLVSGAKELSTQDSCTASGASSSSHPLQEAVIYQHHKEKEDGLSESNLGSVKRPAEHGDETPSKRKCESKGQSFDTKSFYGAAGAKRSYENEHNIVPDSKRIKLIPAENIHSEHKWISKRKENNSDAKHNKYTTVAKKTSNLKRPRDRGETSKGTLTSQVELAKLALKSRRMESGSSFKPTDGQKAKSWTNDDNEDVLMPSTQDMMNLGLPILSAKLPVSKKHLASGLPSQGRLASEDKQLQDKTRSRGELNGFCNSKSSLRNDLLPSVPLFLSVSDSNTVSSSVSGSALPSQSAVTLKTPLFSVTSSTQSAEPSQVPSLVMPNCQTASGSEPAQLITQTHTAVIQPVFSSSELSTTETACTSSVKLLHASTAMSSQPGASAYHPSLVSSLPALASRTIYSNDPTLQGSSKQSANMKSSYQGILKGSKLAEPNHAGVKAISKVTFKDPYREDPYREHPPLQRREAILPQADVSQPKEIPKCKPEEKLYFLTTLLHWNPVWLKEKDVIQSLPALFGSQNKVEDVCCQLRMYYSSFHEYVDITLKLLILECWETIYKDWKMSTLRPPVSLEVHCTRIPYQAYKKKEGQSLVCIEVTGLVTQQNRSSIPSVGDLLIMDFWGARKLHRKYDEPRWCTQFAYVKSVGMRNDIRQFMQTYRIFESSPAWKDRRPIAVNITIILQHRGDVIIPMKLHRIQVISSLKTMDRQIDALVNLPESPLCVQLLEPTPGGLFTYRNVQPDAKLLSKLNEEQARSVATIVQDIKDGPRSPKMFLLQGPPGTGKSHTILALIHQILLVTNFKGRICLAAPSNAAVDEMAKRIINFSHKLKNSALKKISLVRVGNKTRVHPAVKPFMWEDLVEKILSRDIPESLKSELSALEAEALKLGKELSDQSLTQEQKVMRSKKLKEIREKIFKLKADMAPKKNARERYNARCNVLDSAQVICGTLSSLGSEDLKEIVLRTEENPHKKLPFTCLIIDEATQAIEVDCLIPLQYKMNKVVLVGDTEQLPATVLSQMANEKQLARSLFERMDLCIKRFTTASIARASIARASKSPVMMLTRQYRMHNEILSLPNSFFYDRQLVTDKSVLVRKEIIAPYLVFDIQESKESRGANTRSVSNEEEAVCIAQLCEIVSKKTDKIGVICPYTDQQKSILGRLHQRNLAVEVNTVDSFQGQEREVIILSCVRAQSNPSSIGFLSDRKRMNVALTRARLALYVIGHFETLKTDELWEQLYLNAVERNLLVKVNKTSNFKLLAENAVCRAKNCSTNGS